MNKLDEELETLIVNSIKCVETCNKLRAKFNEVVDENGRVLVAYKLVTQLLHCTEDEMSGVMAILSDERGDKYYV